MDNIVNIIVEAQSRMNTAFDNKANGTGGFSRVSIDKLISNTPNQHGVLAAD